jgi:FlaA1/EpsC-like NDP-sugar epimerase
VKLRSIKGIRAWLALGHDTVMAALSFVLALYLRIGEAFWDQTGGFLLGATTIFAGIAMMTFAAMGLYRGVWRYASIDDLIAITKSVTVAVLVFLFAMFLLTRLELMPRSTLVINWLLLVAMLGGPRFLYRLAKDGDLVGLAKPGYDARVPVLLVGAGDRAEAFLRAMRRPDERYRVVGMLDDAPERHDRHIHGTPVLGRVAEFEQAVKGLRRRGQGPRRVLLAEERLDGARVGELLKRADALGMTLARVRPLSEFDDAEGGNQKALRPIAVEDLLGRTQTRLDRDAMAALVAGKRVLVTGAGGTIGGELARQIAALGPASLSVLDASEYALYRIDGELGEGWPGLTYDSVLADVRDRTALAALFARLEPELVFHAAAIKHVPIAEAHAAEAVLTNVLGTRNVADLAREHGVKAMVQVSTDKAVNPTNVMGATKRLAEAYCQALDRDAAGGTRFMTVRFGNVLGSTGSVVPLFQRQLEAGGPLTVTDPEMTRYFMTTHEAVELVLQASAMGLDNGGQSGGIYVLEMGQSVRILDLARQMIRLAGLHPDKDIAIEITGARPGEKMHEELFHGGEHLVETAHEGIRLASPRAADVSTLATTIEALAELAARHDDAAVRAGLADGVPEYVAEYGQG